VAHKFVVLKGCPFRGILLSILKQTMFISLFSVVAQSSPSVFRRCVTSVAVSANLAEQFVLPQSLHENSSGLPENKARLLPSSSFSIKIFLNNYVGDSGKYHF
jgi:hypothetical protein